MHIYVCLSLQPHCHNIYSSSLLAYISLVRARASQDLREAMQGQRKVHLHQLECEPG